MEGKQVCKRDGWQGGASMKEGGVARWRKYVRGRGGNVEQVCKREGWKGSKYVRGISGKVEKVWKRDEWQGGESM